MRFALTEEQQGFADVLDDLLAGADTPRIVRGWADGDHAPGLKLWQRLAETGVTGLVVPEEQGGLGGDTVDLVVAFEALGHHAVPGPWVETAAFATTLLRDSDQDALIGGIVSGETVASAAVPDVGRHALDADVADRCLVLEGTTVYDGTPGDLRRSVDPARRLFTVERGSRLLEVEAVTSARALDAAALACGAQLLGAGERLLAESVEYAKARRQFGRAIGEYQALKHALADVRVGLDFARPLLYVAALALRDGSADPSRDVSAAKVATATAAYRAARAALQVHGAIGYTAEHDLGLWITKVRALVTAWGTPARHRARVLESVSGEPVGG